MKTVIRWMALGALALAACNNNQIISVSISPLTPSVAVGAKLSFTATVTGTSNTAVSWSVKEGASGGTIDASGNYTAPSTPGSFHVVAAAVADVAHTATATVTVTPGSGSGITVALSPTTVSVAPSSPQQFTATVTGTTNTAVSWSVQEGATGGSIDQTGLYTAPATQGTYHVVATSVADATQSATATVSVQAGAVTIQINPPTATVTTGGSQKFDAVITPSTNVQATWTVQEGLSGGTVDSTGLYTAPAQAGTYHVVVTSAADPTKSSIATVTVTAQLNIAVTVTPTAASLLFGQTQNFTANVTGTPNNAVTWTVQETNGGTVNATGPVGATYTAPPTAGTYHVVATSVADTTKSASATVTVSPPPVVVTVSPAYATIAPNGTQTFTATVTNAPTTTVTWSILDPATGQPTTAGGSITAAGVYTAPATGGDFYVVATSTYDTTKYAGAVAHIIPAGGYTLSGTVTYPGTKTGRIFIQLYNSQGQLANGTSISAPGAFTLNGVQSNGPAYLVAYLDSLGTANLNFPADPTAQAQVTLPASASLTVALTDPAPAKPAAAPKIANLVPGNQQVLVEYSQVTDPTTGYEAADHYKLYWSTNPNPGPNDPKSKSQTFRAGFPFVVASNSNTAQLNNGTTYNFALAAVANGQEGPTSAPVAATVGTPTGASVSGTASFSGYTAAGPLYVIYYGYDLTGTKLQIVFSKVSAPTAGGTFTVQGVPDGYFVQLGWLDQDGNGEIGDTDPNNFSTAGASYFVVQGGTVVKGNGNVTLPSGFAAGAVTTSAFKNSAGTFYGLNFQVQPVDKLPVLATLTSGTDASGPIDFGINGYSGAWSSSYTLGPTAPSVGSSATYSYSVTYADSTTATLTASPSELVSGFATPTAPVGTGTATPTFTWSAPSPAPAVTPYSFDLAVSDPASGNTLWAQYGLQSTTLSATYNSDGSAKQATLTSGTSYTWYISVRDADGNSATSQAQFTVQ